MTIFADFSQIRFRSVICLADNEYQAELVLRRLAITVPNLAESKDLQEKNDDFADFSQIRSQ